jgi:glycosyltransferase involved in cell wall biosynthesis
MARDYPLAAYAVRRNTGAKLIVTRHVLFPLNRLHQLTLARVSKVIAVSHAVARDLGAQALVPREKISVIHNGVDVDRIESVRTRFQRTAFLRRWDLPEDRLLVGSVGTLTPLKGYEDFLRAAAHVRDVAPEAFFVISGVDSSPGQTYQSTLERLIGELDIGDHVRLINWMDDITELYCALNIFVSASHSESFGLAIVEAIAAGAAIVATETEGACEIIQDGETGRLVPIGDAEQMAQALVSLINDRETRQQMADAARTSAKETFSLARMVDETEALYGEVLKK